MRAHEESSRNTRTTPVGVTDARHTTSGRNCRLDEAHGAADRPVITAASSVGAEGLPDRGRA